MILLAGYPKVKIDESGVSLSEKHCLSHEEVQFLPKIGSEYRGTFNLDILILDSVEIEPDSSGAWLFATLNYKSFQLSATRQRRDGETEYRISNTGIEKPIETHPNFRMRWKFFLASTSPSVSIPPALFDATTADDFSSQGVSWRWYSSRAEIPEGWFLRLTPEKPGVESYILSSPIIIETRFFKKKRDADANAKMTGVRKVPGETFGIGGTAINWLIMSCEIDHDGRYWRVSTTYQYADEWDTDIYEEA